MLGEILNSIVKVIKTPFHLCLRATSQQSSRLSYRGPIYPITMEQFGHNRVSFAAAGIDEEEMNGLCDLFVCQEPCIVNPVETDQSTSSSIPQLLGVLKNLWIQLEDPLDQRILETIDNLCILAQDTRKDFLNKYKHLVKITGDDIPQMIDELQLRTMEGVATLTGMIKIAIVSYSAALARNAKSAISEISTLTTDLSVMAEEAFKQQQDFRTSLEHISSSWMAVSNSMTNYMTELDKKTLQLSNLQTGVRSCRGTPSTDSNHNTDSQTGSSLILIPDTKYRSNLGILTCTIDGNIGFSASGGTGVPLGKLIKSTQNPKALEHLLNRDLQRVTQFLIQHSQTLDAYSTSTPEQKAKFATEIMKYAPRLQGQWVQIE